MRERERGEFFRARQRVSFRAHTHTHTQRPKTRRKKNLPGQKKKSLLSSSCVDPDLCPNGKGRADLSKSFFLSRARRGANGVDRSIDRGARARRSGTSDRWDRGRLPSLRETTHRIVRGKWGGRARSFKPNTPMNARAHRKLLERFCFRRRTRERKRDDDDDDDDAPSSCTRSTDSPRFFYGLLDCSSRVRFAFAFVSSSRRVPRPPRRRRLRCERFEVALPFESLLLLHRLLLRMYSSVREGESRA